MKKIMKKTNKIIVEIRDGINAEEALEKIIRVIEKCKISNTKNKSQHHPCTVFENNIVVIQRAKYKTKTNSFVVERLKDFINNF